MAKFSKLFAKGYRRDQREIVSALLFLAITIAVILGIVSFWSFDHFVEEGRKSKARINTQIKSLTDLGVALQDHVLHTRLLAMSRDPSLDLASELNKSEEHLSLLLNELRETSSDPKWRELLENLKWQIHDRQEYLLSTFIQTHATSPDDLVQKLEVLARSKNQAINHSLKEFTSYARDHLQAEQSHDSRRSAQMRFTAGLLGGVEVVLLVGLTYSVTLILRRLSAADGDLADYKFALEQTSIVSRTDANGTINYVNDKFLESCEYTREELIGRNHRILKSGHHPKEFFTHVFDEITQGKVYSGDIKNLTKTGRPYWVNTHIVPFMRDGKPYQYLAIFRDITEAKETEERLRLAKNSAEEASRAKTQFLANMSHEIRTPMNAILGFASLLEDPVTSEIERVEFTTRIRSNGDHLIRIIDDILNLSKFEAGEVPVEKIHFSLRDTIHEVVQNFESLARQKGLHFKISYDTLIPVQICSDPLRFRQILTNLIGNAIKFTNRGVVRIGIKYFVENPFSGDIADFVEVTVMDSGVGIDEAKKLLLFRPFVQGDSSVTRRFGGTGLGLALARRMALALGGDLKLKSSKVDQGSVFVVKIPAHMKNDVEMISGTEDKSIASVYDGSGTISTGHAPSPQPRLLNRRILLVEDSPDAEALVSLYLKREGAQIQVAHNGLEALQRAEKDNFDLVLMDVQMPVMDGLEATRRLRSRGFNKPIIALTAHAMKEEVERSHLAGCNLHLTKPIHRDLLVESILVAEAAVKVATERNKDV